MTQQCTVTAVGNILTHLSPPWGARQPQVATPFHSIRPPGMSVHDYLERISKYFQCSHQCFVICMVYLDRITKHHPEYMVNILNVHRLLVTGIMVAAKFWDDVHYRNSYYAMAAGLATSELNTLESGFLRLLQWRLHVSSEEYNLYQDLVHLAASGEVAPFCSRLEHPGHKGLCSAKEAEDMEESTDAGDSEEDEAEEEEGQEGHWNLFDNNV